MGTIYLASYVYNNKDSCYDMSDSLRARLQLLQSKRERDNGQDKTRRFYSVSQIRNDGRFIENTDSSVIPEAGNLIMYLQAAVPFRFPTASDQTHQRALMKLLKFTEIIK